MSLFLKALSRPVLYRSIATSRVLQEPRSLIKMKKFQADFQCEDGRPVWLKAGFLDRVLYATTIVLCYTGVLMTVGMLYDNAKPESWKRKNC